ncbi:MAG: cell division FtsK/SpoIIIE [Candidatus Magasanikbacteria bacterium GW2011_GWC2_41_17]|uniref:Cell division FtsK/SpoIIIE n=1 Tax=Candidatus Magasanikbacteria bacterium GW2011_GWC2_41_17 TaxID=1619048 RepID=A0A0G0YHT2_9BACT|nr:MAG: cell division FtsK/SpoIIIE [Candidatus Magasanikbacteria bacterium GW2011_GWC2_41_17]
MPHVKKEVEKRKPRHKESIGLNPEIKRGLMVIALFLIAGILILSYLGIGGQAGSMIDYLLGVAFGESRLLAPILLVLIGILIELEQDYPHDVRHFLGFFLLLFGVNGIIHLTRFHDPTIGAWKIALTGQAGGLIGFGAGYPLSYLFGFWAALVILGALILASLLLLFNTSLARIINAQKMVLLQLGTFGKIIIGVISLFIKKTPKVADYSAEESTAPAFNFQTRALKKEEEDIATAAAVTETDNKETPALEDATSTFKYTRGLPPLDLLSSMRSKPTSGDIKANLFTIQKTLENFGIVVEMGAVQVGPTVTQYTLKPADGVKLSRLTALQNDLAMALAAHPIRIEAPIPGKSLVGIEVPNQKAALVSLRELLETPEAREQRGNLMVALGKDVSGKPWFGDLSILPHLLIAGATNSGKTVCINAILLSLLLQHTPETLRFILVDPKRVELPNYNGIPHLLTPVITDVQKTVNALRWTIGEMERRFELLSKAGRRDITSYNKVMDQKLPYLVFVIDELADLMTASGAEVEAAIIRLSQMARAVGIHLVLATQRPSVDVITGLIKANMPARLAFSVASLMDSRTILDTGGADKLLGRGDCLWKPPELSKPRREETKKVVEFLKGDELPQYNDDITAKQQKTFEFNSANVPSEDDDPILDEAKEVIIQAGKGSASLLQRRLKVGYARAARLLDLLEKIADGAKPRELLIKGTSGDIIQEEEISEENNVEI